MIKTVHQRFGHRMPAVVARFGCQLALVASLAWMGSSLVLAQDTPPASGTSAATAPAADAVPATGTAAASGTSAGTTPAVKVELEGTPKLVDQLQTEDEMVFKKFILQTGIIVLLIVVAMVLGRVFSKTARMPEQSTRFGILVFAFTSACLIVYAQWPPKLGIDLSGGHTLVYEVDKSQLKPGEAVDLNKLVEAITRRVNPGGIKEVSVRKYGTAQIEITIPNVTEKKNEDGSDAGTSDELELIKDIIQRSGSLEFRILANQKQHGSIIELAQEQSEKKPDNRNVEREQDVDGKKVLAVVAKWVPISREATTEFANDPKFITRKNKAGDTELLVVVDSQNVTGDYLQRASVGTSQTDGSPTVDFVFKSAGGIRFGELTNANLPDQQGHHSQLGVILDGALFSAPRINSAIHDRGYIEGNFSQESAQSLAAVLTAGSLPAALVKEPSTSISVGPQLGEDTIKAGIESMLVSTLVVVVFMLIYYRFAGMVANVAVLTNVLFTVAFMMLFKAAFTLSGLAGLALSVGMAVDANVLIYERMREELARGATLRMAIRNGFDRASVTIIDSNVTTLITGVVLYLIGTDQIKGFATTLVIGILMNLYTAIVLSRVLFEVAERTRWLTQLKMMKFFDKPNYDIIGKRYVAIAFSLIVITIGMVGVAVRGEGLLDIDFTGGVSVELLFDKQQPVSEIRKAIAQANDEADDAKQPEPFPDVTVQEQRILTEPKDIRFKVVTSNQDAAVVQAALTKAFEGKLAHNKLEIVSETTIPAAAEPKPGEKPAPNVFAGGTQFKLQLAEGLQPSGMASLLQEELTKQNKKDAAFLIANKDYFPGSETVRRFTDWDVQLALPKAEADAVLAGVQSELKEQPIFPGTNVVGPTVASNTKEQAIVAILVSLVLIMIYVRLRFAQISFGIAAIVALIHDVLVSLGAVALSLWLAEPLGFLLVEPFKVNLTLIAAFLTIIGYSINDTIVIFDRIREMRGKLPDVTPAMINEAINQTLSRTLLTSLTVFMVMMILYVFGGPGIHGFAFAMVIGLLAGTYSTIFVASPVLIWMSKPSKAKASGAAGAKGLAEASGTR